MAFMNLGGTAVAAIVPPKFNYVGIDGVVVEGQAEIVSSSASGTVSGGVVLSGESIVVSSFTPRYYSPRPATATVTITDQTELAEFDKVTLRSTSAPSADIDFAVDPDVSASATVTIANYAELNAGDKVTLRSTSAPSADIDFAVDPDIAASATVTITDYAELNIGDKVTLRSTSAPSTDIDFAVAIDGSGWDPGGSDNNAASALAILINANPNFIASANNAIVTITQSVDGVAGNTTVVLTDSGNSGMSKTDFAGGADGNWDLGASNNEAASALAIFINANSNFVASVIQQDNVWIVITQSTGGVAGNTTVVLTDSGNSGMSKTDFTGGTDGEWDLGTSNNEAASALATVIAANSNFVASANNAVVTITQSIGGVGGNTTVVLTDSGAPGMSKSDFSGGVDSPIEGGMVLGGVYDNVISSAYSFSGSGGIQSSGSLDEHWSVNPYILLRMVPSGGISLGGLGGAYISNYVGLVPLELGGTSLPFNSTVYLYAGVGGPVMSGEVHAASPSWTYSASGGVSLGGEYYPRFNVIGNDVTTSVEAAATFASDATVGTVDWTSPSSASSDDDQNASAVLPSGVISKYLKSTNFGFSVPSVDTIMGVRVLVDKHQTGGDSIKDESIRLVKDGTIQGDDKILPPAGNWSYSPPPWATMTTVSRNVSSGPDDGYAAESTAHGTTLYSARDTLYLGVFDGGMHTYYGSTTQIFLRFDGVDIPQGAKITSAHVSLVYASVDGLPANSNANGKTAKIYANAVDDSIRPLIGSEVVNANPTTSNVTWTFDSAQTGSVDSPDISSVIQEIVDRDGWDDGQAMTIYLREGQGAPDPTPPEDDWYVTFGSFENTLSPYLEITYYSPSVVEYGFDNNDTPVPGINWPPFDTWGLDLTYDDINDSTFGVVLSAKNDLPSSAAGSVSAFVDYIEMSIYHLKIGATIGGTADVIIPLRSHVGSGGITVSGEAILGFSSSYSYVGDGGLVLSGTGLPYFEDLITSVKYDVIYSNFDIFFGATSADAHVFDVPDVANLCGCDPINPIVNLKHNLVFGSKLGLFVKRNHFTIPTIVELIYNSVEGSWKRNFHYVGIDGIEVFDILFEWSCVDEIGSNELGYAAWKFSLLVSYKNEKVDKDTRVLLVFPKGHFCSRGQRLNASFEINTQSKTTTVTSSSSSSGGFVSDTIINDAVGLFNNNYWRKYPNLEIKVEEEVSTSTTFVPLDVEPIVPEGDFNTILGDGRSTTAGSALMRPF